MVQRIVALVAAVMVVVIVIAAGLAAMLARRPLPTHEGTVRLDILASEVEVVRDAYGVPHVFADTDLDLMRAQGYVQAQDRFFEMDLRRHITAGRFSELVGENDAALASDSVIRTFGWRRVAEQEWDLLDDRTRGYMEAYAEGVNAYLDSREASQLAAEYTVLGVTTDLSEIEPWTPIDSLTWLKAMAWELASNYEDELGRATAVRALAGNVERVDELYPAYPYEENLPIIAQWPGAGATDDAAEAESDEPEADASGEEGAEAGVVVEATEPALTTNDYGALLAGSPMDLAQDALASIGAPPDLLGGGVDGIGSNSFAISGEHTASGAPLLANDPHLGLSMPGPWHQVGLHCRASSTACQLDVSGFSLAGIPGIIIGQNADLAWGLTNMGADVVDFYLHRVYEDGTYLRDGEREPLQRRTEIISINGAEDVTLSVTSTVHGPVVSGILPATAAANNSPVPAESPQPGFGGYAVALAWTALEPGRTADAIFALNLASDADDVAAAAELFEVPAQNIVFATAEGDIGYQAPGRIPVRPEVADTPVPADGSWPRPGWDSAFDWDGFVPAGEMPRALNPDHGFIVAANQAVQDGGADPFLTADFDYGYRSQRLGEEIQRLVAGGGAITTEQAFDLMLDTANPYAEILVPYLLDVPVEDAFVAEAVRLFDDWADQGYPQDADSAAAAYFAAVWANVLELTFSDELPEAIAPDGGSRWLQVVAALLEEPQSEWWDDRTTVNLVESRDEILHQALTEARYELTNTLGKDPETWQWGRLHEVAPEHLVFGGDAPELLRWFVNPTPLPAAGGPSIVNASGWNASARDERDRRDYSVTAVPSMRMVVDLADRDASLWVNFAGNSGHPASRHYTDQFSAWASGEALNWHWSRESLDEESTGVRTMRPQG